LSENASKIVVKSVPEKAERATKPERKKVKKAIETFS